MRQPAAAPGDGFCFRTQAQRTSRLETEGAPAACDADDCSGGGSDRRLVVPPAWRFRGNAITRRTDAPRSLRHRRIRAAGRRTADPSNRRAYLRSAYRGSTCLPTSHLPVALVYLEAGRGDRADSPRAVAWRPSTSTVAAGPGRSARGSTATGKSYPRQSAPGCRMPRSTPGTDRTTAISATR
jgi:hypothetical protein